MYYLVPKFVENILRAKTQAFPRFQKSFFLTTEIDFWLLWSISFLESTKTALNCHTIIPTVRVLLAFIPKVSINSKKHTRYAWCTQKMLRKHFASQNKSTVKFTVRNWYSEEVRSQFQLSKKAFLKPRKGLCFGS